MKSLILDTNVFVRFFLKDHNDHSQIAEQVFNKIEQKELIGLVSITVVMEVLFVIKRWSQIPRSELIDSLIEILELDTIKIIEIKKEELFTILSVLSKTNFDFVDVYLSVISKEIDIMSFDKDFRKLKVILDDK